MPPAVRPTLMPVLPPAVAAVALCRHMPRLRHRHMRVTASLFSGLERILWGRPPSHELSRHTEPRG